MATSIKSNIPSDPDAWAQLVELAGPYASDDLRALRENTPEGADTDLINEIDHVLLTANQGEGSHARAAS